MLIQIYYLKRVDAGAKPGMKGYSLIFSRKEGESVYVDAVFTNTGFKLRAP